MKDIKTILLTTDLSDISTKAVEAALALARKFEARVILTFVGDPFLLSPGVYDRVVDLEQIRKGLAERARKQLADFAAANLEGRGVELELQASVGVPHVEIVNLAKRREVDLIVMAPHGRGFFSHAFMGSTTERVLRRAPCPVLVVREPAATDEERAPGHGA